MIQGVTGADRKQNPLLNVATAAEMDSGCYAVSP